MECLRKIGRVVPLAASKPKSPRLGIGFEKLDREVFDPDKAYNLVAGLGVKYVRIQSGWQRTEKEMGVYDFSWLDSVVNELIKRNMEPWINLCYGNRLYTKKAEEVFGAVGCPPIKSEEERRAWLKYVNAVVRHYKGKVTWYEIWNEPDGKHCWKYGVNAKEYANLAVMTSKAIHEADIEAKAIVGGLCYINLPYCKVMFEHGVLSDADAISFHRYSIDEIRAVQEIQQLRALIDQYRKDVVIIQGESGTQSSCKGAGALRGGAWTDIKQAKHLLRNRIIDLSSEVVFTSQFTALDMPEALNGSVNDMQSYLDMGYFGLLKAEYDQNGRVVGDYTSKLSYYAMQNLAALFVREVTPKILPIRRMIYPSPSMFETDDKGNSVVMTGFKGQKGTMLAYWNAVNILSETYSGTISFQLAGVEQAPWLINLLDGNVYKIPEEMLRMKDGEIIELLNLPLTDSPYLLVFDGFAEEQLTLDDEGE